MVQGPVRLLSIDGGGVRGLSALVMLEQLMDAANNQRASMSLKSQEPWQMFDMIGGTSTGGLIAIMLGRLRMSIADCKRSYIELSDQAFTEKNLVDRALQKVIVGAKFRTKPLEAAIKKIIGEGWQDKLLKDEDAACKVFVVAHRQDNNTTAVLRSYRNFRKVKGDLDEMRIWQACRATSAALTFFEPITIEGSTYSDGGLKENNPIEQLHGEASEMFQNRQQIIVSLGTGTQESKPFKPNLLTVAGLLAGLATETEDRAAAFYRRDDAKMAKEGCYFRFNVPGLGDIGLEESRRLNDIKNDTEKFLDNPEVGDKVVICTQKLAEGAKSLPEIPSVLTQDTKYTSQPLSQESDLAERLKQLRR